MSTSTTTQPKSPPPDWRWRLACAQDGLASGSVDDPTVKAAKEFLRALPAMDIPCANIARSHSDIASAVACYFRTVPYGLRWLLEMHIMTGGSDGEISEDLGFLHRQQVAMYRQLFFDVTADKLKDADYVSNCIIGAARMRCATRGGHEWDIDWKVDPQRPYRKYSTRVARTKVIAAECEWWRSRTLELHIRDLRCLVMTAPGCLVAD